MRNDEFEGLWSELQVENSCHVVETSRSSNDWQRVSEAQVLSHETFGVGPGLLTPLFQDRIEIGSSCVTLKGLYPECLDSTCHLLYTWSSPGYKLTSWRIPPTQLDPTRLDPASRNKGVIRFLRSIFFGPIQVRGPSALTWNPARYEMEQTFLLLSLRATMDLSTKQLLSWCSTKFPLKCIKDLKHPCGTSSSLLQSSWTAFWRFLWEPGRPEAGTNCCEGGAYHDECKVWESSIVELKINNLKITFYLFIQILKTSVAKATETNGTRKGPFRSPVSASGPGS